MATLPPLGGFDYSFLELIGELPLRLPLAFPSDWPLPLALSTFGLAIALDPYLDLLLQPLPLLLLPFALQLALAFAFAATFALPCNWHLPLAFPSDWPLPLPCNWHLP